MWDRTALRWRRCSLDVVQAPGANDVRAPSNGDADDAGRTANRLRGRLGENAPCRQVPARLRAVGDLWSTSRTRGRVLRSCLNRDPDWQPVSIPILTTGLPTDASASK